ncbi:MAG: DUF1559 domain-containing protein [Planctomycetaceae bacterium]|nr:DUF1559 domain-containing protein [Planctomycetaceae bacterium]
MKTLTSFFRNLLFLGLLHGPFCEAIFPAEETPAAVSQNSDSPLATMIAPMIDDQVVLIVHIDPEKFDFDLIFDKTILYIENGLRSTSLQAGQTIDAEALTNIRMNIQVQFDHMFRDFREIRDRLIREAGIHDLFLLVYRDMTPYSPFIMVSPLKDKTADQRRAFARIVRGTFPIMFSEREFMVCAAPLLADRKEETDQKLRARLKELKTSETTYLKKAFAQQEGAAATIVGVIPPKTSEYIALLPKSGSFPEVLQKLGIFITERVKWISVGVDIENASVKIIGQTSNSTEANQIITAITRASANSLEDMVRETEARQAADPNVPKWTPEKKERENMRKLQAEFLPVVSNDNQLLLFINQETKPQALMFVVRPLVLIYSNFQQIQWGNQCALNLKTLARALQKYAEEKGNYPPVWTVDAEGKPLQSWRVLILPYLDEEELFNSIKQDEPWDSEYNRQFHSKMPTVFRCSASRFANNTTTTYSFIVGPNTYPAGPETLKPSDITDIPNSTVMLVERKTPICWMKPDEISEENAFKGVGIDRGIGSDHLRGGCNVIFFDTAIRFIINNPPLDTFKKILTYCGGEEVQLP